MAIEALASGLEALGYTVDRTCFPQGTVIIREFRIEVGRDAGKVVDVGLPAPDYPNTPPAAVYIRPILAPPSQGGVHPCPLGSDWVYWSRTIADWPRDRSVKRIIGFLNTVFLHA
jgi:hypothetical protein